MLRQRNDPSQEPPRLLGVGAPVPGRRDRAPYNRHYDRIVVHQRFDGTRLSGDMTAWTAGVRSAYRTFDRILPEGTGPYVPDAFAPFFHVGVDVHRAGPARLALLGWAVRDDDVSRAMDLRVVGEEDVHVPAGTFPCWRLAIGYAGHTQWYWVRKADGIGVRMLDSTNAGAGVREIVLRSEEP